MKVPKTVKIGGKVYDVEITDNFDLGSANVSAEISYTDLAIRVSPNQASGKMKADFIHELIHGIYDFLGYRDHDEKRVDKLAQALYMVIMDNPDIFEDDES